MLQHNIFRTRACVVTAPTFEDNAVASLSATGAALSSSAGILASVRDDACSLAVWRRNRPDDWSGMLRGDPRDIHFSASRADLAPRFVAALASHGFGGKHLHRALADDVDLLAGKFCSVMGIAQLDLRLAVVSTDSCRKFHADYVIARLITSYVGPGPQWLTRRDAERIRRGAEPLRINQLDTGDVGIFKGRLATDHPAIHRSPPIASANGPRLLLVLNRVDRP